MHRLFASADFFNAFFVTLIVKLPISYERVPQKSYKTSKKLLQNGSCVGR
jgi:hypothetical protein